MVQGGKLQKSAKAVKKGHSKRQIQHHQKKTVNRPTTAMKSFKPKGQDALAHYKSELAISKTINQNIEKVMAGKVVQAGERLNLTDVKSKGKEHFKEVKRGMLKKKKTSIEEKMSKLKQKLDNEENKGVERKPVKGGLTRKPREYLQTTPKMPLFRA